MFPTQKISKCIMHCFFCTWFLCLYLPCVLGENRNTVAQLGEAVFLNSKIPYNREDHDDVKWKHNNTIACKFRGKAPNCSNGYELLQNGTLKISVTSKNNSGHYILEMFHKNGTCMSTVNYELTILEAISGPDVHKACTIDGRAVVTCSVKKGDNVHFQWMLHPNSSAGAPPLPGHIQYFDHQTPGNLTCEAENGVSKQKSATVSAKCRSYIPTLSALAILIVLLTIFVISKKLQKREKTDWQSPETTAESPTGCRPDTKENIYVEMQGNLGKQGKDVKVFTTVLDNYHHDTRSCVFPAAYGNTGENAEDMENVYV